MLSPEFLEQEAEDFKARVSEAVELTMLRASAEDGFTEYDVDVIVDLCAESLREVASVVEDGPDEDDDEDDEFPWFTRGEQN